jgi:hypothetical protein
MVNRLKFLAGLILFGTWVGLVVANVPNSADLIAFIKYALVGLGAHTAANSKGVTP